MSDQVYPRRNPEFEVQEPRQRVGRQMPVMAGSRQLEPGPCSDVSTGIREIALAGAHGGAGATTLTMLLRPALDIGAIRRTGSGHVLPSAGGRPLVLVTRNTVPASASAMAGVGAITAHGGLIVVIAVVSDGLPEPIEAAYRFRVLAAEVGAVVRVPFIAALRVAADPAQVALPRKALRALAEIRSLTQVGSPSSAPTRALGRRNADQPEDPGAA